MRLIRNNLMTRMKLARNRTRLFSELDKAKDNAHQEQFRPRIRLLRTG
jgi:hypothetical protein